MIARILKLLFPLGVKRELVIAQEDIDRGIPYVGRFCAASLAAKRLFPKATEVMSNQAHIVVAYNHHVEYWFAADPPDGKNHALADFIRAFDRAKVRVYQSGQIVRPPKPEPTTITLVRQRVMREQTFTLWHGA